MTFSPHDPVMPGSLDWFKTISFGDLVKIISMAGMGYVAFVNLQMDVRHEAEMRQALELHTTELVAALRDREREMSDRTDARFQESVMRERELIAEVKTRMDRLDTKIDQMGARMIPDTARGQR